MTIHNSFNKLKDPLPSGSQERIKKKLKKLRKKMAYNALDETTYILSNPINAQSILASIERTKAYKCKQRAIGMIEYPFIIHKLSPDDGGGYLAEALDLNGCIADGETIEKAIINLEDAVTSWIRTAQELGDPTPSPSSSIAKR